MKQKTYTAFGIGFTVCLPEEALWGVLEQHLPPGAQESLIAPARNYIFEQKAGEYCLSVDGGMLCCHQLIGPVLEAFEGDLQIFVAEFAPAHIFVHAGVVGWQGQALVFPGRSFHGKSTLVTALLRAGAQYLSDEYAAFDLNGFVHPYPRRISLRQENGGSLRVEAQILGAAIAREPLPVSRIFLCHFEPQAVWRPQILSPGEALLALLDNTVAARSQTAIALDVLGKVVANATAHKSARGEADDCIAALLV